MSSERWRKVEEIFQSALDCAPDERRRFIVEACAGDANLCADVETLVEQYEAAGDFIETPALQSDGGSWNASCASTPSD